MTLDNKRLNLLKKVMENGFTDEKAIVNMSEEEMISSCKTIAEMQNLIAMKKAIKEHRLISFLSGKDDNKSQEGCDNQ